MKINIIIPTLNEIENIILLVREIKRNFNNVNICIVDDSKKKTIQILLKKNNFTKIFYFHRKKKRGRGSAVLFGIRKLIKTSKGNDIFIEMDADFSHKPSEIKKNIKKFSQETLDLLISSRYLNKSKIINWPLSRKIFSFMANKLSNALLKCDVSDYTNGFRIYSKRAAKLISKECGKIGDGFIILSEIILTLKLKNYRINETSTIFVNRVRGRSNVNLTLIISSLLGLIRLFFKRILK